MIERGGVQQIINVYVIAAEKSLGKYMELLKRKNQLHDFKKPTFMFMEMAVKLTFPKQTANMTTFHSVLSYAYAVLNLSKNKCRT